MLITQSTIQQPLSKTNVLGTLSLLNAAKAYWMENPIFINSLIKIVGFIMFLQTEVYGEWALKALLKKQILMLLTHPIALQKQAVIFLCQSYGHTFSLNTVITNCSNNYGPRQHDEKLIPTIIRKALTRQPIPIYGKGQNIRDWLYVEDHIKLF